MQKKNLFDRLAIGDATRDAILQDVLDNATPIQLDYATEAMESGYDDESIFLLLGS